MCLREEREAGAWKESLPADGDPGGGSKAPWPSDRKAFHPPGPTVREGIRVPPCVTTCRGNRPWTLDQPAPRGSSGPVDAARVRPSPVGVYCSSGFPSL